MNKRRFTPWVVLVCMSAIAACTSGEDGTVGNTELNVVIPNNESSPGVPAPFDIQSVEYTINCLGNSEVFLDNDDSFPDEVRLDGNLEVVDDRTNTSFDGPTPPSGNANPGFGTPRPGDGAEVWQAFMDLPPGPCTIELRARDADQEVICTAQEPFNITADTTAKVNLVLVCDVSFQAPVGMLDVDATFSFVVGNFCPDLFTFNTPDATPKDNLPSANFPGLVFSVGFLEVRFRDGDNSCGSSCDPQDCYVTPEGLSCVPAAQQAFCAGGNIPGNPCALNRCNGGDPAVDGQPCSDDLQCQGTSPVADGTCDATTNADECQGGSPIPDGVCVPGPKTTITCTPNGLLDCEGDESSDAQCVITGNTLGVIPEALPTIPCTDDAGCAFATGNALVKCGPSNTCVFPPNPFVNAQAGVACLPPVPPFNGIPGDTITCTAVTTDGDDDCVKVKTLDITCPGVGPCDPAATPPPPDCTPANQVPALDDPECVVGTCNGTSGTAVCEFTPIAGNDGMPGSTSCTSNDNPAQLGYCDAAGICQNFGCATAADCNDSNPCTLDACNAPACSNTADPNQDAPPAVACDAGGGAGSGTCDSTFADCAGPPNTCVTDEDRFCPANNECLVPGDCPAPGCDVGGTDTCGSDGSVCTSDADCPLDPQCASATCDTTPIPNVCGFDTTSTILCDAGGGTDSGQCSAGVCGPLAPAEQSWVVPNVCGQNVSSALVPFPIRITATPSNPPSDGGTFNSTVTPIVDLDDAFLQGAASTLWTMFGSTLTVAAVQGAQVEVSGFAGCTTVDPQLLIFDDPALDICLGGTNIGNACTSGTQCPGFGGGLCGYAVAIPNAPADCSLNGQQDCCDLDPCCVGGTEFISGLSCVSTCSRPPGTCSTTTTTSCQQDSDCPQVPAETCEGLTTTECNFGDDSLCPPGETCGAGPGALLGNPQATCDTNDECTGGGPTNITGPVVLDTFPATAFSCTADVANSPAAICSSGDRVATVSGGTAVTETFFRVNAGGLPVRFDCEPGTLSQPIPCTVATEATDCNGNPGEVPSEPPTCIERFGGPGGQCNDNPTFVAFAAPAGPTDSVCDAASDNAGEDCTADTDCTNVCDTQKGTCDGDDTVTCTADANCAGIGTCNPTCPQFPVFP